MAMLPRRTEAIWQKIGVVLLGQNWWSYTHPQLRLKAGGDCVLLLLMRGISLVHTVPLVPEVRSQVFCGFGNCRFFEINADTKVHHPYYVGIVDRKSGSKLKEL